MASRAPCAVLRGGIVALFLLLWFLPASRGQDDSGEKAPSVVLWVREVNGRVGYWVNDKAVGRKPLTGLERALGPNLNVALMVILDSRVPIREIADIDGMLGKIPIKGVRYYAYNASDPNGMWEILWKPELLPLPKSPPADRISPR